MSIGRLFQRRAWLVMAVVLGLSLLLVPTAFAGGIETKVGDVEATIYAPSVVWQATNAHVVIKLENTGKTPVKVESAFKAPDGKEGQFSLGLDDKGKAVAATKDPVSKSKDLAPGKSAYIAYTYFTPKGSAQLGEYTSNLTIKVGDVTKAIPWTFEVRAGQVFQAETQGIVMAIYSVSAAMLIFWFVYFKGFIKKNFNIFAGEQPD